VGTRPVRITVVGAGHCDKATASIAERVGGAIARRGGVLICGGLGGVMEAAARGAKAAGGLTVGILPGPCAEDANPSIDIPIPTDMGHARNVINVRSADAVVGVCGGYGTVSEIALALKMGIPVVAIAPPFASDELVLADTPEEAVDRAFELARERRT
jgi:uncharacterized protein (TIGR00725 family)